MERILAKVSKKFNTLDELFESEEYNLLWRGFQGKNNNIKMWRKIFTSSQEFISCLIVEKDPNENYGRPFNIYIVSMKDDERYNFKIRYINEVNIYHIMSNDTPYSVIIDGMDIIEIDKEMPVKTFLEHPNFDIAYTNVRNW